MLRGSSTPNGVIVIPSSRSVRRRFRKHREDSESDGAQDWTRTSTPLLGPGPQRDRGIDSAEMSLLLSILMGVNALAACCVPAMIVLLPERWAGKLA